MTFLATLVGSAKVSGSEWSEHSQKDAVEMVRLRQYLGRNAIWIGVVQKNIEKNEEFRSIGLSAVAAGNGSSHLRLSQVIEHLHNERETLRAYEEQKAELEAKLKALAEPPPEKVAERQERQSRLARLAEQRLKLDQIINGEVEALRKSLTERAALTRSMHQEAEAVDFADSTDRFDEERFEKLLKDLPADVARLSEGWLEWFTGKRRGGAAYIVREELVRLPETLKHPHVYAKGEEVRLLDHEASALKAAVAPATGPRSG